MKHPKPTKLEHFYETIEGAFTFHDFYTWLAQQLPAGGRVVEVGVCRGRSAAFLAVELKNHGHKGVLDLVDLFEVQPLETVLASLAPVADVLGAVRKECSWEAARHYADGSLDAVYIDAGHHYTCVKNDIAAWFPKIKPGGVMAGHDYVDTIPGIAQAVTEAFALWTMWRGTKYSDGNYYPTWSVRKS